MTKATIIFGITGMVIVFLVGFIVGTATTSNRYLETTNEVRKIASDCLFDRMKEKIIIKEKMEKCNK